MVIVITNAVAYLVPDMPRKLREHVRRENYLTNEIILKVELEIAKGHDKHLDDAEMDDIRDRIRSNIFAFGKTQKDKGALAEEGEVDEGGGGDAPLPEQPVVEVVDGGGFTGGGGARGRNGQGVKLGSRDNEIDESNVWGGSDGQKKEQHKMDAQGVLRWKKGIAESKLIENTMK